MWSTTFLTGIDFAHDFGDGFIGTAGASVRQVRRPDELQPWALNLQIGMQKKLDFGDVPKPVADKVADAKPKTRPIRDCPGRDRPTRRLRAPRHDAGSAASTRSDRGTETIRNILKPISRDCGRFQRKNVARLQRRFRSAIMTIL
jgi:hypothetical protein